MTSLEALLKEGTKVLEEKKIQEARLDAWLLLEYVTGVSRALYFADPKKAVEEEKAEEYRKLIVIKSRSHSFAAHHPSGVFHGL